MDMAAQPDLWGEIQIPDNVQTPLAILRRQAALLGPKTQNLIEATVDTDTAGGQLRYIFKLVVPTLDNYTYALFTVWPNLGAELYPVRVDYSLTLHTPDDFMEWLRKQLSSPQTGKIITNLLAQVTS